MDFDAHQLGKGRTEAVFQLGVEVEQRANGMANPEHVEIVRRGAEAIARWKKEHPREQLDLRDANLASLFLNGNSPAELPLEITQLTNLTGLYLSDNELTKLPPEIAQLTNLTTLYLGGNRLMELPPEIAQLTNLTSLSLSGNRLTELPPEIAQLTNLTTLYLGGNQLRELPKEITQLQNLEQLELAGNPLTQPPPEIVERGIVAIFEYLRQRCHNGYSHSSTQWRDRERG